MTPTRHRDFQIRRFEIGREKAPLVVVDNLLADPDSLVEVAAGKLYVDVPTYYPGVRARVPLSYQQFVIDSLRLEFGEVFGLNRGGTRFTNCHFSLVTTPPEKLKYLQRIPHVDSHSNFELAFVHYLFRADLGGTAFYRHRKSGFETVDDTRKAEYMRHLAADQVGPDAPPPAYISGDTALYEEISREEGIFNRLVLYRRTSLHSGVISPGFKPDPNPRTGRLSITGFLTG